MSDQPPPRSSAIRRLSRNAFITEKHGLRERHVVVNPKGGWDVVEPGSARASSHHDTQAHAKAQAKEAVRKDGGGEAVVHARDGTIRDKDTVAPHRDPDPPRDHKH